jgi:hypothetical protein
MTVKAIALSRSAINAASYFLFNLATCLMVASIASGVFTLGWGMARTLETWTGL